MCKNQRTLLLARCVSRRRLEKGRGQKQASLGQMLGPCKILAIETVKELVGERFGYLIHISYNGHVYGVTAEQLQPLYPSAVQARMWMETHVEVEANFQRVLRPARNYTRYTAREAGSS